MCRFVLNGLGFDHGKVNRSLHCHIPSRSFWQDRWFSARWLKGSFSSISAVGLFPHTLVQPQTQPLCEANVNLIHTNIHFWLKRSTVYNFKQLENHCFSVWFLKNGSLTLSSQSWYGVSSRVTQGHIGPLDVSPAENWTWCSFCSSAGTTNNDTTMVSLGLLFVLRKRDRLVQDVH